MEGRVEIFDRLVEFARGDQAFAARFVGRSGKRIAIDCIVEVGYGLRVIAFALVDQAAGVKGLGVFGIESDRLIEIGARFGQVAFLAQEVGAAEIGWGVIGIDGNR